MTTETAALAYLAAGFSVIPIAPQTKRPLVPWAEFESRRATPAEVSAWYRAHPCAGVAIVCGAVSGRLAVVDFDPRNGDGAALAALLPTTPTVETGGGGRHRYFHVPPALRVEKVPALLPGVDLQAEASCVMAPPSIHPSGRHYAWAPGLSLRDLPLAPLPTVIRDLIALRRRRKHEALTAGPRNMAGAEALTLDVVLGRLAGVRRCGTQWVARCPAHEDREPSLSVALAADGRVLLHCFAGCPFRAILHALRDGGPR